MTNKLLQELLQKYPDDALVEVETRQKTGYDEGDIHQSQIEGAVRHDGIIVISTSMRRLIGGW
jgi:3-polyprenyl-4-hydroxybenzoate decarboxylase